MKNPLIPLLVGFLTIAATARAADQIWCGMTQHPGDVLAMRTTTTGFEDGNTLYAKCNENQRIYCMGYVTGVADLLQGQNTNGVCLPQGVVVGQLVDVVKKFLKEHPETRHFTATSEIQVALEGAFPCTPKQ